MTLTFRQNALSAGCQGLRRALVEAFLAWKRPASGIVISELVAINEVNKLCLRLKTPNKTLARISTAIR